MKIKSRRTAVALVAAAVAVTTGSGWALAADTSSIPSAAGAYTGCVSKSSGALRVIPASELCHRSNGSEQRITWNRRGPTGASGRRGRVGPSGATGQRGNTGKTGPVGHPGTDGKTILNGTGAPGDSLGSNGDFYLDTGSETLYGPKSGRTWPTSGTSLLGPSGATTSQTFAVSTTTGDGDSGATVGNFFFDLICRGTPPPAGADYQDYIEIGDNTDGQRFTVVSPGDKQGQIMVAGPVAYFPAGVSQATVQVLDTAGNSATITASRSRNGNTCNIVGTASAST